MPVTRRRFLSALGAGAGIATLPAVTRADPWTAARALQVPGLVRVDKNENPAGPFASARQAVAEAMGEAGRYPGTAASALVTDIARHHGVAADRVVLGCGSSEILRLCTERFTSASRALVAGTPTFEDPAANQRRSPALSQR